MKKTKQIASLECECGLTLENTGIDDEAVLEIFRQHVLKKHLARDKRIVNARSTLIN